MVFHGNEPPSQLVPSSQDAVADTLEQLWISYNSIEKLKGIAVLKKLKVRQKNSPPSAQVVPDYYYNLQSLFMICTSILMLVYTVHGLKIVLY